jgi:hypothetical protein
LQDILAENKVIRGQLKNRGGRIRFTDKHRGLLAAKAKALGRAVLNKNDGSRFVLWMAFACSRSPHPAPWSPMISAY